MLGGRGREGGKEMGMVEGERGRGSGTEGERDRGWRRESKGIKCAVWN